MFSSVQCSSVVRCALNRRLPPTIRNDSATKLAVVAGSSQCIHSSLFTENGSNYLHPPTIRAQSREPIIQLFDDNRRRAATTGDGRRRFLTVKNLRQPSSVIVARRRLSAQRKTELNSTQLNSTERPSSVQFSAVYCALVCVHAALSAIMSPNYASLITTTR